MIDIHCHILPFLDDGASDWDAALAMASDALADGITSIVATPHHANGQYMNPASNTMLAVEELNERLRRAGNPLNVLPGQEVRVYSDLLADLEQGELLTLAGSRYLLLEMPSSRIPRNMEEVCHELIIQGIVPIIAHPERNAEVAAEPSKLLKLTEIGVLGQLTAQSLAGTFGSKLQKLSLELCRVGAVHMIASDAHDSVHRPFGLSEAYRKLEVEMGLEVCDYFRDNTQKIVMNEQVFQQDFVKIRTKRQKLFGFFSRKG
ncbi:hypothetical protein A8L34_21290 [Bacillus sp. FJAT-27264]|uniref:tyrosine-protein phosphatase n=1 Tax=Paenibacillus sp. (strain DSM 101736 / FJAT-27264) TaxID=1850362 RepID=UPI000807EBBF|nr:CpsB/CapC family capsule biosynthesis tyrosine phosphatase [Bacillus sp. FJAT-27264]OBZ09809.1 hypothetical protein A8L34_21290 [Bacillus sp. FJAT-27264]